MRSYLLSGIDEAIHFNFTAIWVLMVIGRLSYDHHLILGSSDLRLSEPTFNCIIKPNFGSVCVCVCPSCLCVCILRPGTHYTGRAITGFGFVWLRLIEPTSSWPCRQRKRQRRRAISELGVLTMSLSISEECSVVDPLICLACHSGRAGSGPSVLTWAQQHRDN